MLGLPKLAAGLAPILVASWAVLATSAAASPREELDAQQRSLDEAYGTVATKVAERRAELDATLVGLYRRFHLHGRAAPRRLQGPARGVIRQLLRAKRDELMSLEAELHELEQNRRSIERDRNVALGAPVALHRPVGGVVLSRFGPYRHPSGARLVRHEIELAAEDGELVSAPLSGTVRFVGQVRGFGPAVILSSDGVLVVVVGVDAGALATGASVEGGSRLGRAMGGRVVLAVRVGPSPGQPVDPLPLLRR